MILFKTRKVHCTYRCFLTYLRSLTTMSSSHLYFQLHSTAETFIQSYDQERCRADIASLSLSLTQDCKRYIGPASVGVPSLSSPISNTDYEATESRIFDAAATRSMTMRDITVDEVQRKAVVHVMHSISMKPAYGQGTYDLDVHTLDDGRRKQDQ